MYTIQTNASGTRSMEISEKHLETKERKRAIISRKKIPLLHKL